MSADQSPRGQHRDRGTWSRIAASWSRLLARLPLGLALSAVTAVWAFGAVWSFTEQSAFARAKGFSDPALLPLVLDGLAVAMAGVAFAASLDARPAIGARLGTALAVLASASSNGLWAAERSATAGAGANPAMHSPDWTTVAIGAGIPIAANIAFEVLLGELRRQVQRSRGLPAPIALPSLRLLRLLLAPRSTFREWRGEVLALTAPNPAPPWGPLPAEADAPREVENRPDPLPLRAGEAGVVHDRSESVTPEPTAADGLPSTDKGPATRPALPAPAPATTASEDATDPATESVPVAVASSADPESVVGECLYSGMDSAPEPEDPADAEQDDGDRAAPGEEGDVPGDGRVQLLSELLGSGAPVTGAQAAVLLSHTSGPTSSRTGRRLLAEARQIQHALSSPNPNDDATAGRDASVRTGTEDAARPGAALSLVTRRASTPPAGELP